jgi:hypothetical protein
MVHKQERAKLLKRKRELEREIEIATEGSIADYEIKEFLDENEKEILKIEKKLKGK